MTEINSQMPTQDERLMAALAHASTLLPMMGVIAPIIIWVTQKEKSKYVAFQSLQALAFQLTMMLAWFVGMGCYMMSFFGMFLLIPFSSSSSNTRNLDPVSGMGFLLPFLVMAFISIGALFFIGYGIVGAVNTFQGKPFRYVIIGKKGEDFLQPKQAVEVEK